MTDAAIKAAEKRGYGKGYAAGKARKQRVRDGEQSRIKQNAFWQRAFLSLAPAAMQVRGWRFGETPISSSADRIKLASAWADHALSKAIAGGRL